MNERQPHPAIDLLPEVAHVGIHEVVEHVRGLVPNPLGEARAADHLAAGSHQHLEDRVLPWRQRDRHACAGHPAGGGIEREVGHAEHRGLGDARPAKQGPDTGEQLGEREGLGEVVVCPGPETADAIGDADNLHFQISGGHIARQSHSQPGRKHLFSGNDQYHKRYRQLGHNLHVHTQYRRNVDRPNCGNRPLHEG